MTAAEDIAALEHEVKAALEKARIVHRRVMLEQEDVHPSSAIALMEMSVRNLAQADDCARFARHALGGPLPGSKVYAGGEEK